MGTFIVVTPVRNGAEYIAETIQSVTRQHGCHTIYYHVQDGGSTDGTRGIVEGLFDEARSSSVTGNLDLKLSFAADADRGMYDGLVKAFDQIVPQVIQTFEPRDVFCTWLNSDDILAERSLSTVAALFEAESQVKWITGISANIDPVGRVSKVHCPPTGYAQVDLAVGLHDGAHLPLVQQEGTFWRHDLWLRAGGVRTDVTLAGDFELWTRFAQLAELVCIEAVTAYHRRHAGQLSADRDAYIREVESLKPSLQSNASGFQRQSVTAMYNPDTGERKLVRRQRASSMEQSVPAGSTRRNETKAVPGTPAAPAPERRPWPKISIVTPSFNQGAFLEETIQSVLDQNYPNVEHIVIDGGSTDGTREVLDKYRDKLAFAVSEPDEGQSDAINKGMNIASGSILTWLNSDDRLAPRALWHVAEAFIDSKADMVAGVCEIWEGQRLVQRHLTACGDGPLPLGDLLDLDTGWLGGQFFYQPEVFFTRSLWMRSGGRVATRWFYSMDYELWLRFALAGARLHTIGTPVARFRIHDEQKTSDRDAFRQELYAVRDRFASLAHVSPNSNDRRGKPDFRKRLRVAFVNDKGFDFGAGIAHFRLALGVGMAGHDVRPFVVKTQAQLSTESEVELELINAVEDYDPDLVIIGNLHSAVRESVHIVDQLSKKHPCFWVAHDFWSITGRCAYMHHCLKYFTGCDDACPTPGEYPSLDPDQIRVAWERKWDLLRSEHGPTLLANSSWTETVLTAALRARNAPVRVARVRLGVPQHYFHPADRREARDELGIQASDFVIAFSAATLTDPRKGWHLLKQAIESLTVPSLTILLVGRVLEQPVLPGVVVVDTGYLAYPGDVAKAMTAADVYVGPSSEETFGQVFTEAAMCGTPVIGLNQTGVRDAVVEGVTGTLVPPNAESLRDAILKYYDDRTFRESISISAGLCGRNEFSLEKSYASLHAVWRKTGVIDDFGLPHKIAFTRSVGQVTNMLGVVYIPRRGVSNTEASRKLIGSDESFRWCDGPESSVYVLCPTPSGSTVTIRAASPLYDVLNVAVSLSGAHIGTLEFSRRDSIRTAAFSVPKIESKDGPAVLEFRPDRYRDPTGGEGRRLAFALLEVVVVEPAD